MSDNRIDMTNGTQENTMVFTDANNDNLVEMTMNNANGNGNGNVEMVMNNEEAKNENNDESKKETIKNENDESNKEGFVGGWSWNWRLMWVNLIHMLLIAPLLAYVGWNGTRSGANTFMVMKVLAVIVFLFHTWALVDKMWM
jgi:hypothetical protein